jgi:plastocyanin
VNRITRNADITGGCVFRRGLVFKAFVTALFMTAFAVGTTDSVVTGVVRVSSKPYEHAVVWLDTTSMALPPRSRPVMDQRNLQFAPKVLAVQAGTTVDFPNNDRVFHNVFSYRDGTRFDLGLYPVGSMKRVQFDRPGVSRIFCNIHPQMAAYIVAVDSPLFAVSDKNGTFMLQGVPAGTYTYHAWRAGADQLTGTYATNSGQPLDIQWP